MDKKNLERLIKKYGGHGDVLDARFKKAVSADVEGRGNRGMPYAGMPTLLDAPHAEKFDGLDVALVGVPMDLGVTNRPGARFGPRALRTMERTGPYHHHLHLAPMTEIKVADVGYDLAASMTDIEEYYGKLVDADVRPLSVGGDHSITYPILKALGREAPVGLVHFDAHCDTAGEREGTKFTHAGPFRMAVLDGVLDPARCIQIGIRGGAEFLWEFSEDSGMTVIHVEEFIDLGVEAVTARAREVVGDGPVYVSFDIDSLDPSFAPGTGTPEVGGLSPLDVQRLFWGLAGLNVVGGDVVEVAPQYDSTTNTALTASQMLFEILCLMALSD